MCTTHDVTTKHPHLHLFKLEFVCLEFISLSLALVNWLNINNQFPLATSKCSAIVGKEDSKRS